MGVGPPDELDWFRIRVSGFMFSGLGVRLRSQDLRFLVSRFRFQGWLRASCMGSRVSCMGFKVSYMGFTVSYTRFRVSYMGFMVAYMGFRLSYMGFRVSYLGAHSTSLAASATSELRTLSTSTPWSHTPP